MARLGQRASRRTALSFGAQAAKEQWRFPTGEYVTAPVPAVGGGQYGPQLIGYVLHRYYHAHVTQKILLAQIHNWGIEICAGQLNHRLTEGHDAFHQDMGCRFRKFVNFKQRIMSSFT